YSFYSVAQDNVGRREPVKSAADTTTTIVIVDETPGSGGVLLTIAPTGVSPGRSVNITGTRFDPIAANNIVTFTPMSGPAVTDIGSAIVTLDANMDIRRLTATVPPGVGVGTVAVRVINRIRFEISNARGLEIVSMKLSDVASASAGAVGVAVRIAGSTN